MVVSVKMSYYLEPPNLNPAFIARIESERQWMLDKIEHVKRTKLTRRPSAAAEIRDLSYQIRQRELELAFKGPEWANYEKYGIWESLTS